MRSCTFNYNFCIHWHVYLAKSLGMGKINSMIHPLQCEKKRPIKLTYVFGVKFNTKIIQKVLHINSSWIFFISLTQILYFSVFMVLQYSRNSFLSKAGTSYRLQGISLQPLVIWLFSFIINSSFLVHESSDEECEIYDFFFRTSPVFLHFFWRRFSCTLFFDQLISVIIIFCSTQVYTRLCAMWLEFS